MPTFSSYTSGLKVGLMTQAMWVTFLMGQVHGSHPQTKLSGLDFLMH